MVKKYKNKNILNGELIHFLVIKIYHIKIFNHGGWHFSYLKNAKDIELKLKSYFIIGIMN